MYIHHSISCPPILSDNYHDRWRGSDQGMVACWLRGIEKAKEDPSLAAKAIAGELPTLAWKGGVEKKIKSRNKIGSMYYLATWQGLRGDDLNIDLGSEVVLTCTRTGVPVTFTQDIKKLLTEGEKDGDDE